MAQRPPEIPSDFSPPRSRGRLLGPWFAAWAVMACVAACYLLVVSIRPAFLDGYLPVSDSAAAATAAQTAADLVNVRDSVSQLQNDMSKVHADVAEQSERDRSLADRVTALEQKIAPPAEAALEPADPPPAGKHSEAEPRRPATAGDGPKVLNKPIETGSVGDEAGAPQTAAPVQPKPKAAAAKPSKPVGIKLATGSTVDNLRVSWGILTERHSDQLKPLKPRYHTGVDGNGIVYDLVAGPFKSVADAKKLCKDLQTQAISCQVSEYSGNAL